MRIKLKGMQSTKQKVQSLESIQALRNFLKSAYTNAFQFRISNFLFALVYLIRVSDSESGE